MQATYIEVSAEVRYWEDATINGQEDRAGDLVPMRQDKLWTPVIRLADGTVEGWPQGMTADIHYKVCDQGEYWLLDAQKQRIAKWRGDYVPDAFLCHGDSGYGDYIILKIDATGAIAGWNKPSVDPEDWIATAPLALRITDRPGVIGVERMRALFEASVRQTEIMREAFHLDAVLVNGAFSHYANPETDRFWSGFAIGMRCAERLALSTHNPTATSASCT